MLVSGTRGPRFDSGLFPRIFFAISGYTHANTNKLACSLDLRIHKKECSCLTSMSQLQSVPDLFSVLEQILQEGEFPPGHWFTWVDLKNAANQRCKNAWVATQSTPFNHFLFAKRNQGQLQHKQPDKKAKSLFCLPIKVFGPRTMNQQAEQSSDMAAMIKPMDLSATVVSLQGHITYLYQLVAMLTKRLDALSTPIGQPNNPTFFMKST